MLFLFSLLLGAEAQITNEFNLYQPMWNPKAAAVHTMEDMDMEYLHELAANDTSKIYHAGHVNYVNYDLFQDTMQIDGGFLSTTEIFMDNAISLAFYFSKMTLPEGSALFILPEDGVDDELLGPFTHETRWDEGNFQTRHLQGNRAQIQVFHLFENARGVELGVVTSGFSSPMAGACNINVICKDPVNTCNSNCNVRDRSCSVQCTFSGGNPNNKQWADSSWQPEQDSVVAIGSNFASRFCSGAFINNANRRPYVLTAAHCSVSSGNIVQQGFFNPTCSSTSNTAGTTSRVAGNLRVLASNSRIDNTLIEVQDTIPSSWGVYLAGYDTTTTAPTGAVAIHHPSGANMKISNTDSTLSQRAYSGGIADHWFVPQWTEATTEPGRSTFSNFKIFSLLVSISLL
jgi:hypothetical protein